MDIRTMLSPILKKGQMTDGVAREGQNATTEMGCLGLLSSEIIFTDAFDLRRDLARIKAFSGPVPFSPRVDLMDNALPMPVIEENGENHDQYQPDDFVHRHT
jgi:hypothetical protein